MSECNHVYVYRNDDDIFGFMERITFPKGNCPYCQIAALTAELERMTYERDVWRDKQTLTGLKELEEQLSTVTAENKCMGESIKASIEHLDRLTAENARYKAALDRAYEELKHAYIYVKSREKMADVGIDLYLETMSIAREALKGERDG
jgi:regulator of replication initiation timing